MTFLFPSLALLGTVLVLVPLVVHLISRRRRKRIQWSAMEFLLESSRRNQNRSRLEELLLLIMRMLAIGLAGLLAAVPQLPQQLSGWFSGEGAKHLVILDNSYSMAELVEGQTPWNSASEALTRLLSQIKKQGGTVHLLQYSDPLSRRSVKDITSINEFGEQPSKLATSPTEALLVAKQWLDNNSTSEGSHFVTVLSDFRRRDHADDTKFQAALESLSASAKDCLLAHCASNTDAHDNRSLLSISLLPGPRTVGVEARAEIAVANRSDQPAAKITVEILQNGTPLTSVEVGPFQPSETIERSFPLLFKEQGAQVLTARLPDDVLPDDNLASLCLDVPSAREVLLVARSSESAEAISYSAALAPHPLVPTGWQPTILSNESFDDAADLSRYAALFLLDVEQFSLSVTGAISEYLQQGGGVFVALGANTDPSHFNTNWYQSEPRMMPRVLDLPTQAESYDPSTSLLSVSEHPALKILLGNQNGFLPLIRVNRFYGLQSESRIRPISIEQIDESNSNTDAKVLLRLPTGEPLLIEHAVGGGRVMTMLTMVAKSVKERPWSNLATLPIFPVMVNEFTSWLSQSQSSPISISVGTLPESTSNWQAWRLEQQSKDLTWLTLREESVDDAVPVMEPGTYQLTQLSNRKKSTDTVLFTANADPDEGKLDALSLTELLGQFGEVGKVLPVEEVFITDEQGRSWESAYGLAICLLALLILERILAMRCSHLAAVPNKTSAANTPGRKS